MIMIAAAAQDKHVGLMHALYVLCSRVSFKIMIGGQ